MKIEILSDLKLSDMDKNQIEELNREIFPDNLIDDKYLFNSKQNNPHRLLIKHNGEIIGHLIFIERRAVVNLLYIGEVMVKKLYRNKGIGKMLMSEFIKHTKDGDFDAAILICEDEVEQFYKKCGFENFDKLKIFLNDKNSIRLATGKIMGKIFRKNAEKILGDKMEIKLGNSV